ncbi:hypothetical protein MNBD_GAMMA18-740 [hydrothermal vent metagenome]|uniref:Transmembrane protein n=1 Tax=hydrothermal vent metagenome TaxID=652676 RepID=A0A3B0Z7D5_9ZZZZ
MNQNSFSGTVINFIVQSIIVFFAILTSINLFYSYIVSATSISGFKGIHKLIIGNDETLLLVVIFIWLITQIKMVLLIIKNKGKFNIASNNYDSNWIAVIWPAVAIFYLTFIFVLCTLPAFIIGGVLSVYISEEYSVYITIAISIFGFMYLNSISKNGNNDV